MAIQLMPIRPFKPTSIVCLIGVQFGKCLLTLKNVWHFTWDQTIQCVHAILDRNMLEYVQRYATRIPYGRTRPPYEAHLRMSKLTTFEYRRHKGDPIFCFRVLHNQFTVELSHFSFSVSIFLKYR